MVSEINWFPKEYPGYNRPPVDEADLDFSKPASSKAALAALLFIGCSVTPL